MTLEPEHTGRLLGGRYQVGPKLGEGGMGIVYVAVQQSLGRRIAVKVLHSPHVTRGACPSRWSACRPSPAATSTASCL